MISAKGGKVWIVLSGERGEGGCVEAVRATEQGAFIMAEKAMHRHWPGAAWTRTQGPRGPRFSYGPDIVSIEAWDVE